MNKQGIIVSKHYPQINKNDYFSTKWNLIFSLRKNVMTCPTDGIGIKSCFSTSVDRID